jgi:hypothetical protein
VTKTWIVQSMTPPEMPEKICCESIVDAACGWAKRMFRQGYLVRTGTSVLVRCVDDPVVKRPTPASTANRGFGAGRGMGIRELGMSATTYQVKISIVDIPAFQARLEGVVYEGVNGDANDGARRG